MSIESDNNLTTLANRIPVTVLSGFLGSGKTTLLNQLLNNLSGMKVAIIVNDMSHINIDADDLKQNVNLHYGQDELVEMSNGCICCTLRADLLQQVSLLARKQQFDYLLIESTGISEPMPVAETFAFLDQNGFSLSEVARLDTMVTVVNGQTFLDLFNSKEEIETEVDGVATTKKLSDLLIEQVEYANTLLISHIDVITDEDYLQLKQLLQTLNPAAEILPMKNGEIAPEVILNTEKFDLETLVNSPSWMKQMDTKNITSESDTYGFSTWSYHKRLPFHPNRLLKFLTNTWENGTLYRCKGYFWVANNVEETYAITQSAGEFKCGIVGRWWRFISPSDWPEDDYRKNAILEKWDDFAGDCRQEIVFIGRNIDWHQLEKALDECLLTLEEIQLGPLAWNAFEGVNAFHDFCIESA